MSLLVLLLAPSIQVCCYCSCRRSFPFGHFKCCSYQLLAVPDGSQQRYQFARTLLPAFLFHIVSFSVGSFPFSLSHPP